MKSTRVVQITDLHILPEAEATLGGVDTEKSLSKVLSDISELSPPADLIVASGDLTDDGSKQAYRRLQGLLTDTSCPVYVLAGNHDETEIMVSELVGGNIWYERVCNKGGWKLLFVNTKAIDGSHGFVDESELTWLQEKLEESTEQSILLAMHHTPLRLCASSSCQLHNADELLRLLSRYPQVKGLVAGHTHNDIESEHAHFRIMTTPSTMLQVTHDQKEGFKTSSEFWNYHQADATRHGYRVVDLQVDGNFSSKVHWVAALL